MKNLLLLFIPLLLLVSCKKQQEEIAYQSVQDEIVLPADTAAMKTSTNRGAMHADSIISGYIQAEYVSTGMWYHDIDNDQEPDLAFDIVNLHKFNPQGLPQSFDTLAARVHEINIEVLDNSTFGYTDALEASTEIGPDHHYNSRDTYVLGTFLGAGQFKGAGARYLGFRIPDGNGYHYGWMKIAVSASNDTIRIFSYAWHKMKDEPIAAGQTSILAN